VRATRKVVRRLWSIPLVHSFVVHPIVAFLPDGLGRRLHDWHAVQVFDCTPEQAASQTRSETSTEAFVRGLLIGLLPSIVLIWILWRKR
jgi:hypothetical protein